mgnify:CR=1 FL=1
MKFRTDFVFEEATSVNQMKNLKEAVQFDAFNPNGLVARKRKNDHRISDLINQGVVPPGWFLAYGSYDDYWVENMYKLAKKKRVSGREQRVARKLLLQDIEKVEAKIAEVAIQAA